MFKVQLTLICHRYYKLLFMLDDYHFMLLIDLLLKDYNVSRITPWNTCSTIDVSNINMKFN